MMVEVGGPPDADVPPARAAVGLLTVAVAIASLFVPRSVAGPIGASSNPPPNAELVYQMRSQGLSRVFATRSSPGSPSVRTC